MITAKDIWSADNKYAPSEVSRLFVGDDMELTITVAFEKNTDGVIPYSVMIDCRNVEKIFAEHGMQGLLKMMEK